MGSLWCCGEHAEKGDESPGFVVSEAISAFRGAIELNMEVVMHNWFMIIYYCLLTLAATTKMTVRIGITLLAIM